MKTALTIAGSDSGAGAGIQADLKTFAALGIYGTCAITAITAQNTMGITTVLPLPADIVSAQMEAVAGDIDIDVTKTGMLATAAIIEAVAAAIDALDLPRVVVDPVMMAHRGTQLLEAEAVGVMKSELLRRTYVVTPNGDEASVLAGMPVRRIGDAREAARRIHALGPHAVIVTGGHLHESNAVDLLFDGQQFVEFSGPRLDVTSAHGTGCTFAAAVAAHLALGATIAEAAERAKRYVSGVLAHGLALGRGRGPLDHFWMMR